MSLYERENLTYTILLGHSYGGPVAGGLTDTIPTKISALIYLVAVVPVYGKSVLNLQFDDRRKSLLAQAIGHNGNPQPLISLYGILIKIRRSGKMPIVYHNR